MLACWFLGKNLSNFIPPVWKLHNPCCHIPQQLTNEIEKVVDLEWKILFSRPRLDVWRNLLKTSGNGLMHFRWIFFKGKKLFWHIGLKFFLKLDLNFKAFMVSQYICRNIKNYILLPKLFWPTVRKNCSSDWEKLSEITRIMYSNSERSEQFLVQI